MLYVAHKSETPQIQHRILCGTALDPAVLRQVTAGQQVAAIITDPPYCSGARSPSKRMQAPSKKYDRQTQLPDFPGDSMDPQAWALFTGLWLREVQLIAGPDAYLMVFTDWRQLGATCSCIQMAGWLLRGVAVWDKTRGGSRPQRGYLHQQAEFIAWATSSYAAPSQRRAAGVHRQVHDRGRVHMAQKPVGVIEWLISVLDRKGVVLDPFAGSLTTVLAADAQGRASCCVELSQEILELGLERLRDAGFVIRAQDVETA